MRRSWIFALGLGFLGVATAAEAPPPAEWLADVQEQIQAAEYAVTLREGTQQAPNRAQGFRASFEEAGVRLAPRAEADEPAWSWGLTWIAYGRGETSSAVPPAALSADGSRIDYRRDGFLEWYENGPRGLKHGFVLPSPPPAGESELLHLDLALSGTLVPALTDDGQAIEFLDGEGKRVLRYAELVVTDARGEIVPAWMELEPASRAIRLVLDAKDAVFPLTIDPLATSPAWTTESNQASAQLGTVVATAGDVNGDGYSDVLVGAPLFDNGQTDEGRAFLFFGSASGLSTGIAWSGETDQAGTRFGTSLATAGDINGDGYAEFIVGAPFYDNVEIDEGRAFVYFGSAGGVQGPIWVVESNQTGARFGASVAPAGDVNGDGYADVLVGAPLFDNGQTDEGRAYLFLGSDAGLSGTPSWTTEGNQIGAQLGYAVATAGDVNGDGLSDVVVGIPFYDGGIGDEGRIYVYMGTASGVLSAAVFAAESDQLQAEMGFSVGTAGDVNGDGYADFFATAPFFDNGQTNEGRVYLYHGGPAAPFVTFAGTRESNSVEAYFGWSAATAGDVNGDGYADLIVGAPLFSTSPTEGGGQAYVYFGSPGGLAASPGWNVVRSLANSSFGWSVATAGDVNGDGYADVLVGAPLDDNGQSNEGRAYAYLGGGSGPATSAGWTAEGNAIQAQFGWAVAPAGDVNGDGFADVVVGVPFHDASRGRAEVYLGGASGLAAVPSWTVDGQATGVQLGWAVRTAGDVNGDGYDDVIVGARSRPSDLGNPGAGAAYVYLGSPAGLGTTEAWSALGTAVNGNLGYSVGTAGDVNGDGYADVIVGARGDTIGLTRGRAFVHHGSAAGLSPTSAWTVESGQANDEYGRSAAAAGDVNGDGFSDVIVGAPLHDNGQTDEGRAYVYHGSYFGLSMTPAWTAEGNNVGAELGVSVASAGDTDGNGCADVLVGARQFENGNTDEGAAFLYLGLAGSGLQTTPFWTVEGNQELAELGWSVASAGDVNGDGRADLLVGDPWYEGPLSNEGRALLYLGSALGPSTTPAWAVESNQAEAWLGWAVASAGDVNGDGYADVLVGSRFHTNGQTQEGRASLFYGNGGPGIPLVPRQRSADDSRPVAHLGASESPHAFRLAMQGRSPFGRGNARLQWDVLPADMRFPGFSVAEGALEDTGVEGVPLQAGIQDLDAERPYHWRLRLKYDAATTPFAPHSRWITAPWKGWQEAMLRTGPTAAPAGEVTGALDVRWNGVQLRLAWEPSCGPDDLDYAIYEGAIGSFGSHVPLVCTTHGSTITFINPSAGNRYYLVVPHNGTWHGSYGSGSNDLERPESAMACRPQQLGACP